MRVWILAAIVVLLLALSVALLWLGLDLIVSSWLSAMIREYGVQVLFAVARTIGFALTIWLTVVIVNLYRDRDERRNIGEKERKIIEARTQDRDDWRQQCEEAKALAGGRLAIIRTVMGGIGRAAVQLRGAGDAKAEPVRLRKAK